MVFPRLTQTRQMVCHLEDVLLYAFITPRHRAKDSSPKGSSTQSSVQAYQRDKTLFNGFLMICK